MLHRLWTPTGGVNYHRRALEQADRLWLPYREALAAWLEEWRPAATTLLLLGPSGGYTLPESFLTRFSALSCFDPDPLARVIFGKRFGRALRAAGTSLEWSGADLLSEPAALRAKLLQHPGAAVLLSGLLGQLRCVYEPEADLEEEARQAEGREVETPADSPRWRAWKQALVAALDDHAWATVHDRVSGAGRVNLAHLAEAEPALLAAAQPTITAADRADLLCELPDSTLRLAFRGPRGTAIGFHGTEGLLPDRPRRLLLWPIGPDWIHLMEAVSRG